MKQKEDESEREGENQVKLFCDHELLTYSSLQRQAVRCCLIIKALTFHVYIQKTKQKI